jgi:flagellar secretion chaperone FliS
MYNGAESYFENGVLSADPVELVRMLYRGCIDAVEQARQHLREGDIAARSAQLTRAGAIIAHLTFSVNRDADATMGANLVELYDYMQRRLLRANLEQADAPLGEVSRLLSTLLDAWAACGPVEAGAVETTPTQAYAEAEPVETAAAGVWSQAFAKGANTETASEAMYGQPAEAGAFGQTVGAAAYAEASGAGFYGHTVSPEAYGQTADASVYGGSTGGEAYGQTVDAGLYSQTASAGAYVPASSAQTVAAGVYGDEEQEVEYAGKSWDF